MLSVPKSRINIKYRKHVGDAEETVELPGDVLVVGDFNLREPDDELSQREKINVNQRNFNAVMKQQNLSLNFSVPNRLTEEEGEEMNVNLKFSDLESFRPEQVVSQVDELSKIKELRDLLLSLKSHVTSRKQFRRELERLIKTDVDSVREQLAALGYLADEEEAGASEGDGE